MIETLLRVEYAHARTYYLRAGLSVSYVGSVGLVTMEEVRVVLLRVRF